MKKTIFNFLILLILSFAVYIISELKTFDAPQNNLQVIGLSGIILFSIALIITVIIEIIIDYKKNKNKD